MSAILDVEGADVVAMPSRRTPPPDSLPAATERTTPKALTPPATSLGESKTLAMPVIETTPPPLDGGHPAREARGRDAAVNLLGGVHRPCDAHSSGDSPTPSAAMNPATPNPRTPPFLSGPATSQANPNSSTSAPFPYHHLRDLARTLDDLESARISVENRMRSANQKERLPAKHEVEMLASLARAEHCAVLDIQRMIRTHPLWDAYGKGVRGCGEKQFARLLAEIGDPAIGSHGHWVKEHRLRDDDSEFESNTWIIDGTYERTVSQLWRYCGLDPTARITKGASKEDVLRAGKPRARMILHLVSTSMLKSGNREVYDARRAHTAVTHADWTKGHSHNDALRLTAKDFLKGLWRAARSEA